MNKKNIKATKIKFKKHHKTNQKKLFKKILSKFQKVTENLLFHII